jgi:hypothetical protein
MFYCRHCWSETAKNDDGEAQPDWKANRRARKSLLQPFKDQTVVAIAERERPFRIRVGSLRFFDAGETPGRVDELGDDAAREDLWATAWIYRCPLRSWPFPWEMSPWDFVMVDGAVLRIRRSLNDKSIHDELRAIVRMTSPASNPDPFFSL